MNDTFGIDRLKAAASAEIRALWDRIEKLEAELDELRAENWGLRRNLEAAH
jgi:uncharacterized protein (UPF0335 family)